MKVGTMLTDNYKKVIFLTMMILSGSLFAVIYLVIFGNTDQMYNDIIVEYTSKFSSNKSAERNLLFILIFSGIAIYGIFYVFFQKGYKKPETAKYDESLQKSKEFLCALITMSAVYLLIYSSSYQMILMSLIYASVLCLIDTKLLCIGICNFYLGVYSAIGAYRIYVFMGGDKPANNMVIAVIAVFLSVIPLVSGNRKKAMIHLSMIENLVIPFSLLVFLSNKYKYEEKMIIIDVPDSVRIIITALISVFVLEAGLKLVKRWKYIDGIDGVITYGSCVAIMSFNRFDGSGAIMSTDIHHPFENIIGFSQVFQLGQKPFKNYIPVSGMYSIVQGWAFDLFGDGGTFANYFVTNNLFYLMVIVLIVALFRKHIKGVYVLLDYLTDGQATTAMMAEKYWNPQHALLIYNIDTYVEPGEMNSAELKGDGFIPCFQAEGNHWSFVRLDAYGKVVEIKEKERISDYCTLGAYYFKTCSLYKDLYDGYYGATQNAAGGEKYVAPLYNYLLSVNGEVYISDISPEKVHVLGTPEELQIFLDE